MLQPSKKKYFLFILFCTIYSGCEKEPVSSQANNFQIINLNDTSEVAAGQTVKLANGELVFRFDSLIQEGRCPIGVMCCWQGHASIHISYHNNVDTLDTYFKPIITYGNYKILLIDLLPYPVWQQPIDRNSYIAKLKVTQ